VEEIPITRKGKELCEAHMRSHDELLTFRRYFHPFSFYASTTMHRCLKSFKTYLELHDVIGASTFIIHHVRKIALRECAAVHGIDRARELAGHSVNATTIKFYLENKVTRTENDYIR